MRLLGYLFLVVLILAGVGYFRGWFSITTTHAGGKTGYSVGVDPATLSEDAKAAAAKIGELSGKAAEAVKSLARKVGAETSELEGSVVAVDAEARDLSVKVGSETIDLRVPAGATITQAGAAATLAQVAPQARVKLTFLHKGESRQLSSVEILK